MGPTANYQINKFDPTRVQLDLEGFIQAGFKLPVDYDFSEASALDINFKAVEAINSGGVKIWLNFISMLSKFPKLKINYINCTQMVITQIVRIEGFAPSNIKIVSIQTPIYCGNCDQSFSIHQNLHSLPDNINDILDQADPDMCNSQSSCKKTWEVDLLAEEN